MKRVLRILAMGLAAVVSCFAASDTYSDARLKVSLLSEQQTLRKGTTGALGLHFQLQPGWHIYWINPGDSGEPPKVQWQVPAGIGIDELQWPVPERISAFSLVDYGYSGSVLLSAPIKIPADFTGSSLPLVANVKWVVCREVCVPGKATLQRQLEIGATARDDSASAELFNQARSRLPKPAPAAWKATAKIEDEYFVLNVKGAAKASGASYFPIDSQIDNAAPQIVTKETNGITLRLKKSEYLNAMPKQLEGVLKLPSGEAFAITAPLSGAIPAKQVRKGLVHSKNSTKE